MKLTPQVITGGTLVLAISASLYGQGQPATSITTAPAAKKPASSGLVNDWLREESSAFKHWDIGGQVRGRYELFENANPAFPNRDFQRTGVDNDNDYLWFREKLHVGYNTLWFSAYAEGRNSNAIGDEDPKNPGEDSFDLHQAYFAVGNAKEFPLTARIGRQEFLYGDERLIGPADWGNTGRVFDAAKLRFENEQLWVDAFASRVVLNQDGEFNEPDWDDWLYGVYASSKTLVPVQESQLYFLSRNTGSGGAVAARDIYSVGARVKSAAGKLKGWDYAVELVGQFGSIVQGGRRRDQQAFASSVAAGYTWKEAAASPRLGVEYNFSTGDSDPTDDTSETLDNLFPTNHKHYGIMDVIGWRNIHDARLSLSGKPHKKVTVGLDYHLFWLADTHDFFYPQAGSGRSGNGYGRNPHFDSFVGSELDLDINLALTPWAVIRTGYGHFFAGGYIDDSKAGVGGSTDADWFYLQAAINF